MILTAIQITELQIMIEYTLQELYDREYGLIQKRINERTLVHRFATYFERLLKYSSFRHLDLDCEYNRNMADTKRTKHFPNGAIPDMLIHKRESNEFNLLVLEFKGYWNNKKRTDDIIKLNDLTDQNGVDVYQYGLGGFIELGQDRANITYFIDYAPETI